ncbi:MAG: YiiX/YebB-like N1pC/P60 family cysteine hydrolase, partial [Planctomycetaceae bacterium]
LQKAVSRLISDIYVSSGHTPQLPPSVRHGLLDMLQPGDVLITRKEHALTNYFLPGFWPHAAFYIGNPSQLAAMQLDEQEHVQSRWQRLLRCDSQQTGRVVEAMKDGVWIRSVASPLASDAIALLRPQIEPDDVTTAIGRGLFHDGKPYDFDFDFTRSDRLVCTEVVYRSLDGVGGVEFTLKQRAGRLTLAAEDLVDMALEQHGFEAMAVYVPGHTDTLVVGPEARGTIQSVRNAQ